jgi:hypothetical protein
MKKLQLKADALSVATFVTAPGGSAAAITEPCLFTPSCPRTGAGSCWCTDYDTCNCP